MTRPDAIMAEVLSWQDVRVETIDIRETNDSSILYVVEDERNEPKLPKGSRVQIDIADRRLVKDKYYLCVVGQGRNRRLVLGRFRPARDALSGSLGLLDADNDAADPVMLTAEAKVVGRMRKAIVDY